jgi:hypothetical protein
MCGARDVALFTADLFAESLGQRDIEHQDVHENSDHTLEPRITN